MTECSGEKLRFQGLNGKQLVGAFDGERLSSDGGALLFRELCESRAFFKRVAQCFTDLRNPSFVTHSVETLLTQRILGLVLGYEDLNDHDRLRSDPILQLIAGRRKVPCGDVELLASHSTLNRLELCPQKKDSSAAAEQQQHRYHKIVCDDEKVRDFFIEEFIAYAQEKKLTEFIIDFNATDVPLHGKQEDAHYHGYYGHYCYLPLYAFCNDFPLWAELRPSNIDGSLGTEAAL